MPPAANPKRVLVTGVHGLIGSRIYARLAAQPERFAVYGLDRSPLPAPRIAALGASPIAAERLRLADISDLAAVAAAMAGMETVIHLAADPNGRAGWESVLANNIVGTHNLFEAAQQVGVQRVIFASTNQVVFGYRAEAPYQALLDGPVGAVDPAAMPRIGHTWPTRPLNDYACSKIFGEALAHVYANSHGLSCLVVRIGWVTPDDRLPSQAARGLWCSQRDITQLLERCVDAPASLRFDVFFGQSDNRYNLVDLAHTQQVLGYAPQDRAEDQLTQ